MTDNEFIEQVQPHTTEHGYGCGDCCHTDDAHSGVSTGSGRIDGSGFGSGGCFCEDDGLGSGRGSGRGKGNGYGSYYCTGGKRI